MIPITHILKDMLANRTRLILTIFAVAWGTFSIAGMLAVGEGLRLTFGGMMSQTGKEVLVVSGQKSTESYLGQPRGVNVSLTMDDKLALQKALNNRAIISGKVVFSADLSSDQMRKKGRPVTAIDSNYTELHTIKIMPGGRMINFMDEKEARQVVVLGAHVAERLFKPNEQPVGRFMSIGNNAFRIIGIQRESLNFFQTSQMPDEYTVWIPYHTYQVLTGKNEYTLFSLATDHLEDVAFIQNQIKHIVATRLHLNPADPGMLNFINLEEQKRKINLFFTAIEIMLGFIGGLTLIVAGVGIANVMYISVTRATREIGIRMAIGATTYDILAYYAAEALLTTAIGGLIGLFLTKILLVCVSRIPMDSTLLKYFGSPHPVMSWQVIFIVMLALGIVGCAAGLFPARKAALINPAEALRYE